MSFSYECHKDGACHVGSSHYASRTLRWALESSVRLKMVARIDFKWEGQFFSSLSMYNISLPLRMTGKEGFQTP